MISWLGAWLGRGQRRSAWGLLGLWALGLALGGEAQAASPSWGPWGDRWAPVGAVEAKKAPAPPKKGLFEGLYRFYRRASRPGLATCPFYPTCSGYFITAVRERGPLLAGLYTFDRFHREHQWLRHNAHHPVVTPHGTPRYLDPVPLRAGARERGRPRK